MLSVVIPMYNVEEYIAECLHSVLKQTYRDLEIIVVDDGCTDGSVAIVKQFQNEYPNRIQLVHQENGGLSAARNTGIQLAKGDYLTFLDSDDYIDLTLYEKMMQAIEDNDICICDIQYFGAQHFKLKGLADIQADTISKRALLSPIFAWNKIYKTEYFKQMNVQYPLRMWYEDIPVTTVLFASTQKIAYVENVYVYYRQRKGSIMNATASRRLFEIFEIMQMVCTTFEERSLTKLYYDELEYLCIEHLCLYGMFRFMRSMYDKELFERSRQFMKAHFPNWKQNKYIASLNKKNQYFLKYLNPMTYSLFKSIILRREQS